MNLASPILALTFVLLGVCPHATAQNDDRPTASGRGTVRVVADELVVTGPGTFDPAPIIRMLSTRRAALQRCYETALAMTPALAGTLRMSMTVTPEGSVSTVHVAQDALRSAPVAGCVTRILRGFRFVPGPVGGSVTYVVPFHFQPSA
jgi:hypothetical protein